MEIKIDINSEKSIDQALQWLDKNNQKGGVFNILMARKYIFSGKFHKAKEEINIALDEKVTNKSIVFLTAKMISLINTDNGLKVILIGIRKNLMKVLFSQKFLPIVDEFTNNLNYKKSSDTVYLKIVSKQLISFLANCAYDQNKIDLAFYFEQQIYNIFITGIETEEAFKYGMQLTSASAISAGERFSNSIIFKNSMLKEVSKPRVGFFFHNASTLAHISNLHSFLSEAYKRNFCDFIPIIFCLGGRDKTFIEMFEAINVQIIFLDIDIHGKQLQSVFQRLKNLKFQCSKLKVEKLVWGCLSQYMLFAFASKITKEQIWWSQKWQSLTSNKIDKSIYSFDFRKKYKAFGNEWLGGWFQKDNWLEEFDSLEVAAQKERYRGKLILGSLARTDKLNDTRYLKAICEILKQNDGVVYLWTGRQKDEKILSAFKESGVLEKTEFVGWVNTSLFANILDLLLDTFPTGNGVTALQSMQAGTPVVMFDSLGGAKTLDLLLNPRLDEENVCFETSLVRQIFSDSPAKKCELYPVAKNEKEYIEIANTLIRNSDLRSRIGNSYKECISKLFCNPSSSYERFTEHLLN